MGELHLVCVCLFNDKEHNVSGTKPRDSHLFLHSRTWSVAADDGVVRQTNIHPT